MKKVYTNSKRAGDVPEEMFITTTDVFGKALESIIIWLKSTTYKCPCMSLTNTHVKTYRRLRSTSCTVYICKDCGKTHYVPDGFVE